MPFSDALNTVMGIDRLSEREREVSGARIRLESAEENNGIFQGEATRIRAEDFPAEVTDVGLEIIDADRIGFGVAFAYDSRLGILAIQYDVRRVSPPRLGTYLSRFDERALYNFESVPKEGAWEEFEAGTVKWFQVRLALPDQFDMDADIPMANELNSLANAYQSPYITIKLGMGHKRGNLLDRIKETATELLGRADVEAMKAKTVESGGEINLMDELLHVKDDIDLTDPDPEANYRVRKDFVRRSLADHRAYLARAYG